MAIDFPKTPSAGETYSAYSITWQYDGVAWKKVSDAIGGGTGGIVNNFTEGATAPSNPTAGDRWLNTVDGKLYTAITDNSGIIWVELSGAAGTSNVTIIAGSTGVWTNSNAGFANGIAPGITFPLGASSIQVLEQLIYPYQPVSFIAGSLNMNLGTSPFDIGRTLAAGVYTASWSTTGPAANWTAGSIVIRNATSSTTLISGLNYNSSPVGITHPSYGYTLPSSLVFGITGNQLSGSIVSDSQTYRWAHRIYWGKSSSASPTSISNLTTGQSSRFTSSATSLGTFTYTFIASGSAEYCYVIVPTSPGSPGTYTTWKDSNNLSFTPVSGTFTETNAYGVSINWTWYQVSNPTTSTFSATAS